MTTRRIALGVLAALVLPILLSIAAYFVSARSLAATPLSVRVPSRSLGSPRPSPTRSPSETDGSKVDLPGNCDEAEHKNDPECATPRAGGTATPDDSGSTPDDNSTSDISGSGSSGSGSDSGSSGGSGSSGSSGGSGSDDSGGSGSSGGDD